MHTTRILKQRKKRDTLKEKVLIFPVSHMNHIKVYRGKMEADGSKSKFSWINPKQLLRNTHTYTDGGYSFLFFFLLLFHKIIYNQSTTILWIAKSTCFTLSLFLSHLDTHLLYLQTKPKKMYTTVHCQSNLLRRFFTRLNPTHTFFPYLSIHIKLLLENIRSRCFLLQEKIFTIFLLSLSVLCIFLSFKIFQTLSWKKTRNFQF